MTNGEFGGDLGASFELPSAEDDSVSKKILEELFTTKNLNFKTDLSDKEIKILTRLVVLSDILGLKNLTKLTNEFKELRISKKRMGRNELVEALSRAQERRGLNKMDAIKSVFNL